MAFRLTIYHSPHATSRIDFFTLMQKSLLGLAINGLNAAQEILDTARHALDHGIVAAMNSAPEVRNVMPNPEDSETEGQFIGRFMADAAMKKEYSDERQRAAVAYKQWAAGVAAKNAREDQNIRTSEFTVPVIYADVITYKPGELGNNTAIGREGASVYYTPEALKDAEYLRTVESSLISVGTHDKNTNEHNKDPDGFVRRAYWDENEKRVVMDAMAVGEREITYIERNKNRPGFGSSAYLKFLELRRATGVAPSGKPYDAIATKLVNDHVAIMDNVRDPRNAVIAMNANEIAMNAKTETQTESFKGYTITYVTDLEANAITWEAKTSESGLGNISGPRIPYREISKAKSDAKEAIIERRKIYGKNSKVKNSGGKMEGEEKKPSKEEIRNTIEEMEAEKARNEFSKKTEGALNDLGARMGKLETAMSKGGKNAEATEEATGVDGAPNAEDKDKGEEAEMAKNAKPSEETIADVADHLGMTFATAPTFNQLGSLLGCKGKTLMETVTAVNAKRKEIVAARNSNSQGTSASAANAQTGQGFYAALNNMGA